MLTVESANNGRNGVLGLAGALLFGAGAACLIIFMGGTLGMILGAVCGTIGLVSGIVGLAANWKQSKSERDMAYLHNAACAAEHLKKNKKEIVIDKSVSSQANSVSTAASTDIPETTRTISKIIKADGTSEIIEGSLNDEAKKNLKLVRQEIKTVTN